jgi:hypothetical protein
MLTNPFPKTAALKDAAEKSANLLAVRTERFVEFRVWKEDKVKRVKARAESRMLLLEKQHGIVNSKINAEKLLRSQSTLTYGQYVSLL